MDVRDKCFKFGPSAAITAVEPVTGGTQFCEEFLLLYFRQERGRGYLPMHFANSRTWGFFPPRSAGAMMLDQPEIDRTLGDTPQAGSKILGDLGDTPREGSKTLGDFWESSSKDQAMPIEEMIERSEDDKEEDLKTSTSGMEADLQEWCLLPEVALPFAHLDASDGSISPLDNAEMEELKKHIQSGHLTKSHLCKGCLTAEGPRRIHGRVRDVDKATHMLAHRHRRTIDKIR